MATKKSLKKKTSKVRRTPAKKSREMELKSFHVYHDKNFMEFKISRQTVYWVALVSFIILMQLWIIKTQIEAVQVTDSLNLLINS